MHTMRELETLARKSTRFFFDQVNGSMLLAQTAALLLAVRTSNEAGVKSEDKLAHFLEVLCESGRFHEETVKWLDEIGRDDSIRPFIEEALSREFDFSPGELDEVESRLDQLYRLKKKYGATVEEMLTYLDRCRQLAAQNLLGEEAAAVGWPPVGMSENSLSNSEASSAASIGSFASVGLLLHGPCPVSSQLRLTSGNSSAMFAKKSALGLFLPDRICEIEAGLTPILEANLAGLSFFFLNNWFNRSFML